MHPVESSKMDGQKPSRLGRFLHQIIQSRPIKDSTLEIGEKHWTGFKLAFILNGPLLLMQFLRAISRTSVRLKKQPSLAFAVQLAATMENSILSCPVADCETPIPKRSSGRM